MYQLHVSLVNQTEFYKNSNEKNKLFYHFLQTPYWASFKALHGWKYYIFKCDIGNHDNGSYIQFSTCYCTVLERSFGKFGSIGYIPLGIELLDNCIPYNSKEYLYLLEDFASEIRKFWQRDTLRVL